MHLWTPRFVRSILKFMQFPVKTPFPTRKWRETGVNVGPNSVPPSTEAIQIFREPLVLRSAVPRCHTPRKGHTVQVIAARPSENGEGRALHMQCHTGVVRIGVLPRMPADHETGGLPRADGLEVQVAMIGRRAHRKVAQRGAPVLPPHHETLVCGYQFVSRPERHKTVVLRQQQMPLALGP